MLLQRRVVVHVKVNPSENQASGDFDLSVFMDHLLRALDAAQGLCRSVTRARRKEAISEIEPVEKLLTAAMLSLILVANDPKRRANAQAAWAAASESDPAPAMNMFTRLSNQHRVRPVAGLSPQVLYCSLGSLSYLDDCPGAIEAFRHATRIAPTDLKTAFYLGCLLNRDGKFDEFRDVSERIINGDHAQTDVGTLALTLENMGHASWNLDRYDDAEQHYRRAIARAKDGRLYELEANIRFVLAQLHYKRFIEDENPTGRYNFQIKHDAEMIRVQRVASAQTDPVFYADLNMQIGDFYARTDDYFHARRAWGYAEKTYARLGLERKRARAIGRQDTTVMDHNKNERILYFIWKVFNTILKIFTH